MALIDLQSDLSWYGTTPPAVNNITDRDAKGFTTKEQQLNPSRFVGISNGQFLHTGNQSFGILGTANYFTNDHNDGFTLNIMPVGTGRPDSQFIGISGTQYETTSLLGNISDNIETYSDDRQNTRFETDSSNIPFVNKGSGFDNHGAIISIPPLLPRGGAAENEFAINDATFNANGTATRQGQLGEGSPFVKHLGWNKDNKYSTETDGGDWADGTAQWSKGLAFKYTANTPIEEMYDAFKLRDDAHDPYGYAKPPFILRGIQKDETYEGQRWGPGIDSILDLPRGGPVTFASRAAADAARLGKFLIRPPGIAFLAKQFGLQLTNPNVEGVDGTAKSSTFMTKLYDPVSSITNAIGGALGLRTDRHFPPIVRNELATYEGVFKKRGLFGDAAITKNRLVLIRKDLVGGNTSESPGGILGAFQSISNAVSGLTGQDQYIGKPISQVSGLTGPGSLLGIGATTIRRWSNTTLAAQKEKGGLKLDEKKDDYQDYTYGDGTYENLRGKDGKLKTRRQIDDDERSLKSSITNDGIPDSLNRNQAKDDDVDKTNYKTNEYKDLKRQSEGGTATQDFRETEDGNVGGTYDTTIETAKKKIDEVETKVDEKGYDVAKKDDTELTTAERGYYKVLGYNAIRTIARDNNASNKRSFSGDSKSAFSNAGTSGETYGEKESLETKYGYLKYSDLREQIKEQADEIQSLEGDYAEDGIADLINFKFQALRTDDSLESPSEDPIIFRAYINTLSDGFQPQWGENQDQGRADAKIMYEGFARSISLDFVVPVHSKKELKPVWSKLEKLAKLTYPIYASSGFTGTYVKTTIGDLYKGEAMYMTDLSYDWDNETPWELSSGEQLPFYTNVSMTLGWIGAQRPDVGTTVFSYNASS
jgi:hypothetical protein